MAGLGRRTHYRKHLTDSVLYDLPEPKEDERIAKVVATRGGNQFDIILANADSISRTGLAILPTKFHKLVWVKRGDYVIVQTGIDAKQNDNGYGDKEDEGDADNCTSGATKANEEGGIRFIVSHILYKDQVKHLTSKGLWPMDDPDFESGNADTKSAVEEDDDGIVYNTTEDDDYDDDGIVYNDYDMDNDDDLFVNTNRIARLEIQDSESEEESSDEGE